MLSPYRVRDATPEDVRAVAAFQTECWREAYRGVVSDEYLDTVDAAAREGRWRERIASGTRHVAVAWCDDDVAGVVSWGDATSGTPALELKSLYVGAAHRGTGLARTLTHHAIQDRHAQLWVFEDNPRAQRFYAKLGFAATGDRTLDPDTSLWMARLTR